MNMPRISTAFTALLVVLALSGCVALPIGPHDIADSRQNIGTAAPVSIVAGTTTRTDVLLLLGEPDHASEHHLRFTYTRRESEGGIFLILGSAAGMLARLHHHHLVLRFNDDGTVASASFDEASCYLQPDTNLPCTSKVDDDVLQTPALAASSMNGKADVPLLAAGYWHPAARGYKGVVSAMLTDAYRKPGVRKYQDLLTAKNAIPPRFGNLVLARDAILFFAANADRQSDPVLRISYSDIESITLDTFLIFRRIVVALTNGKHESFDVAGTKAALDSHATEQAAELAKSLWRSARQR